MELPGHGDGKLAVQGFSHLASRPVSILQIRPRRAGFRLAAGLLAALHLLVPGVAGAVDLLEEAHAATAQVHLEEPGSDDCATQHDHLFCQVVRTLTQGASAPGSLPAIQVASPLHLSPPAGRDDAAPRPETLGELNSRAPPAA